MQTALAHPLTRLKRVVQAVTRLPDENIRLQPGDQLLLQHRPRRISTFGAPATIAVSALVMLLLGLATAGGFARLEKRA